MRILIVLFVTTFVISMILLAYFFGQKSVELSIASLTPNTVKCSTSIDNSDSKSESTLSFPLIKESKASTVSTNESPLATDLERAKESIDTTVIHAIRNGTWSEEDNSVFLTYVSHLNKKERISILKQMNKAINYQQMKIGSYIPNF
ncbi:MAG: hypothetical protein ACC653_04700 [Gammaproteobacteria bacterium]